MMNYELWVVRVMTMDDTAMMSEVVAINSTTTMVMHHSAVKQNHVSWWVHQEDGSEVKSDWSWDGLGQG